MTSIEHGSSPTTNPCCTPRGNHKNEPFSAAICCPPSCAASRPARPTGAVQIRTGVPADPGQNHPGVLGHTTKAPHALVCGAFVIDQLSSGSRRVATTNSPSAVPEW